MLEIKNLKKNFYNNGKNIEVLKNINLSIKEKETLTILGPSGSGKSTLLSLIATFDQPTSGEILFNGQNITNFSQEELTHHRSKKVSVIFQHFHLINHLTAEENVSLPLDLTQTPHATQKARETLEKVGLSHRLKHLPGQLSGGEKQRVAIARALVTRPSLLLADEPSGNLDQQTGEQVMDLLFQLVESHGMSLLLITHDQNLAQRAQKVFTIDDGQLNEITQI